MRHLRLQLAFALLALYAREARAHEPPKALSLLWASESSVEPSVILANRGLVFAEPQAGAGPRLSLRCNEAYGANTADWPGLFVGPQPGVLTLGVYSTVLTTADRACTLEAGGGLPHESLSRVVRAVDAPHRMYVSTRTVRGHAAVFVSEDHGASWLERYKNPIDSQYDSVLVAASDPQRLYAAGMRVDRVNQKLVYFAAVSLDAGQTWQEHVQASKVVPFAVHPKDADVLFAYEPIDAVETQFRILRSEDRGATFSSVLEGVTRPTSLAEAVDGASLWLGLGEAGGLYRSSDAGRHFERVLSEAVYSVSCLVRRQHRLWMCANMTPNVDGVWFSDDDGASFQKWMVFQEVTQPVACDAAEANAVCAQPWLDYDRELQPVGSDAGVPVDAGPILGMPGSGQGFDAGGPSDSAAAAGMQGGAAGAGAADGWVAGAAANEAGAAHETAFDASSAPGSNAAIQATPARRGSRSGCQVNDGPADAAWGVLIAAWWLLRRLRARVRRGLPG